MEDNTKSNKPKISISSRKAQAQGNKKRTARTRKSVPANLTAQNVSQPGNTQPGNTRAGNQRLQQAVPQAQQQQYSQQQAQQQRRAAQPVPHQAQAAQQSAQHTGAPRAVTHRPAHPQQRPQQHYQQQPQQPMQQQPQQVRQRPVQHQPVQHQPVQHQPVQHQPVQHQPVQHQPVQHQQSLLNTGTPHNNPQEGIQAQTNFDASESSTVQAPTGKRERRGTKVFNPYTGEEITKHTLDEIAKAREQLATQPQQQNPLLSQSAPKLTPQKPSALPSEEDVIKAHEVKKRRNRKPVIVGILAVVALPFLALTVLKIYDQQTSQATQSAIASEIAKMPVNLNNNAYDPMRRQAVNLNIGVDMSDAILSNPKISWFQKTFCKGFASSSFFCDYDKPLHPLVNFREDALGISYEEQLKQQGQKLPEKERGLKAYTGARRSLAAESLN